MSKTMCASGPQQLPAPGPGGPTSPQHMSQECKSCLDLDAGLAFPSFLGWSSVPWRVAAGLWWPQKARGLLPGPAPPACLSVRLPPGGPQDPRTWEHGERSRHSGGGRGL